MIDLGVKEKLQALKDRYFGESPDALVQLEAWEKQLFTLSAIDDFANLPTTKAIAQNLKDRLVAVIRKRALGQGHTPDTLKELDARENEIRYALNLFMPAYSEELETLVKMIENEL